MQHPAYKVAVVQACPSFLDLDKTIDICCRYIEEAAENGARLIAFPESFVPGFPIWIFETGPFDPAGAHFMTLFNNSIEVPDRAVRRISEAARKNGIYVSLGVSERENATLFLSQLWFDDQGNLIGRHRKLKPTGPERFIWGEGDGSTMGVMKTDIGNLGGLICWEHRMPINLAVMAAQNEQVHVGAWNFIGSFVRKGGLNAPLPEKARALESSPALPMESSGFEVTNRYYAMGTQSYVLAATMVMTQDYIDAFCLGDEALKDRFKTGGGSSRIINPQGITIGDILPHDQEGLIYADINLEQIVSAKYMCDTGGHYSSPHVASLNFNTRPAPICHVAAHAGEDQTISYDALREG